MTFMDDFINQAICNYKVSFEILVIAMVFMCCVWSINWVTNFLDSTLTPIHLGFILNTMERTIASTVDRSTQVETWVKNLIVYSTPTQVSLESLLGTLITTILATEGSTSLLDIQKIVHSFPEIRKE